MPINIAFAGLRHGHIFVLYDMAQQSPLYNICGAYEENAEAKKRAESLGVACNYQSFEQLLEDDAVDAVALGGCYGDRGDMAIRVLEAGKHVMADKPLCTDLATLDKIEDTARQKGKLVSCMFTMRYEAKINAVKKLAESGVFGEINNVYFGGQHPLQYGRRPMWYFENGKHGGVINDIAIHGIDVLCYALGLDIESISAARCWNKYANQEPQFKDSAQFMLTMDNGAGVVADVSYAIPDGVEFELPYYWQFYIWGTKGTIRFSINEEKSYYYVSGDAEPQLLKEEQLKTDYLTDFYDLTQNKKSVILNMDDVFKATRKTLEIQKHADTQG